MQTLLFSATLRDNVNKLAQLTMRKPIRLSADPDNSTAEKLHQQIFKLSKSDETTR
jgi:superfamily II DNA/RNA helicase